VDVGPLLGRGGFAAVYRGRHRALDTDVAVKIVETPPGDAPAVERVLREARLMARLDHPNLLRIYDAGRLGASIYLVLEMMDGGSLLGLRKVPAGTLTDLAQQLPAGLQALHEANVLHRDVKPRRAARLPGRHHTRDHACQAQGAGAARPARSPT
jgi:serine/threonine protein kinase